MKNLLTPALAALLAIVCSSAQAYIIVASDAPGGTVGSPAQQPKQVQITLPSDPAQDAHVDTFTVYWNITQADVSSLPSNVIIAAHADFTVLQFSATQMMLSISLYNDTTVGGSTPGFGTSGIESFGFYVAPTVTSAQIVQQSGAVTWAQPTLNTNLTGNFKNLSVCVFTSACNGGPQTGSLQAGASDTLWLSMTGNFAGTTANEIAQVMLSSFPVKFQTTWGSFEVPGSRTDCCEKVPEPPSAALALLGAFALSTGYYRQRRRLGPARAR
ncbi:MAG: cistern family PEP-CTERM protein [Gammaproteobacteria bacterium]|nr:cistern family PEP-CTERM protein [Gammaproteobacteria bacterium]